jgi:polysaccharide biosynthesis protein PslH
MKVLNILLVMLEPPLPFGNPASRWYYVLLKGLVEQGHRVTAIASCSQAEDAAKAEALFPAPEYNLRCYPVVKRSGFRAKLATIQQPYSYMFSPSLRQDLAIALAQPYDILHLEALWSGWLGLEHRQKSVVNVHYLFSLDGVFQTPKSLDTWFRKLISNQAEQKLLRAFPHIITLSDRLAKRINQISPSPQVHIIPLGIDLALYPFSEHQRVNQQPVVSLIGGFAWAPTYSAAERLLTRLWPAIKRQVPTARLQIVGRSAKDALAQFADLPDLEIYQDVPDTLPYFLKTDVLLYAPIAGSGMKVKVMEAFALGAPVVTTAEGVEGLPAQDGIHAGICEDDQGLIDRTVALLNNQQQRQAQRLHARQLLENYCSPAVTIGQVSQVYQRILA